MTPIQAFDLLRQAGAPPRLVQHARLVGEAGDELLVEIARLGVTLDNAYVRAGIVLHDVGKAIHRDELDVAGALHEPAGEALLLARGVEPQLARICRSHAQWATMECSVEELIVALADKLWKGVRHRALEERVIDAMAARSGRDRWDLYVRLDNVFERVAAGADDRLARSVEAT
jgi:hypothetical protein